MVSGIRGFARHVNQYLSGVLGADAYQKYVEHHRNSGHQGEPMTVREFWRDRTDRQDSNPQGRCC
ncbi:MAG: YbdD/YjiX family protein [Arthrobacter sp.]